MKNDFDFSEIEKLKNRASVEAPTIKLPKLSFEDKIPSFKKEAPVDLLWFYWSSFLTEDLKERTLDLWRKESGVRNVISYLKLNAQNDTSRIYFVSPYSKLKRISKIREEVLVQPHLNPKNKQTMIVMAVNDLESKEIKRIADNLGIYLFSVELRRGENKLNEDLVNQILHKAYEKNISKILLVEFRGSKKSEVLEEKIRKEGYNLRIIDHHVYEEKDRGHHLSSLEQFALEVGYKLSFTSKAIGVKDSSFLNGLLELGVTRENIYEIYLKHIQNDKAETLVASKISYLGKDNWGDFYLGKNIYKNINSLHLSLLVKSDDFHASILNIKGREAQFIGNPQVATELHELMKPFYLERKVQNNYLGGDPYRNMFWSITKINPQFRNQVLSHVARYLNDHYKDARLHVPKSLGDYSIRKAINQAVNEAKTLIESKEELDCKRIFH